MASHGDALARAEGLRELIASKRQPQAMVGGSLLQFGEGVWAVDVNVETDTDCKYVGLRRGRGVFEAVAT